MLGSGLEFSCKIQALTPEFPEFLQSFTDPRVLKKTSLEMTVHCTIF
jgi:hypothetical protein